MKANELCLYNVYTVLVQKHKELFISFICHYGMMFHHVREFTSKGSGYIAELN